MKELEGGAEWLPGLNDQRPCRIKTAPGAHLPRTECVAGESTTCPRLQEH